MQRDANGGWRVLSVIVLACAGLALAVGCEDEEEDEVSEVEAPAPVAPIAPPPATVPVEPTVAPVAPVAVGEPVPTTPTTTTPTTTTPTTATNTNDNDRDRPARTAQQATLIESARRLGNQQEANRLMRQFIQQNPSNPLSGTYQRLLGGGSQGSSNDGDGDGDEGDGDGDDNGSSGNTGPGGLPLPNLGL